MKCDPGWILITESCVNVTVAFGLSAIVTTAMGWAIGWFSRLYFDNRRLQQEKDAKRSNVSRDAVESAMRWLDPMTLMIGKTEHLASMYLFHRIDRSQFKVKWPKEFPKELEALEVPSHLRPYLPTGIQQRGTTVIAMFHEFHSRIVGADRSDNDEVFEALHYGQDIRTHIDALRRDLEAAHANTLD